jgi:hypothetical protein
MLSLKGRWTNVNKFLDHFINQSQSKRSRIDRRKRRTLEHKCMWVEVGRPGKFLLVLASTVILDSDSRGTHDPILLSHDSESRGTLQYELKYISSLYTNWVYLNGNNVTDYSNSDLRLTRYTVGWTYGSHSDEKVKHFLLGCDAVYLGRSPRPLGGMYILHFQDRKFGLSGI